MSAYNISKCARTRRLRSEPPDYGFQNGRGLRVWRWPRTTASLFGRRRRGDDPDEPRQRVGGAWGARERDGTAGGGGGDLRWATAQPTPSVNGAKVRARRCSIRSKSERRARNSAIFWRPTVERYGRSPNPPGLLPHLLEKQFPFSWRSLSSRQSEEKLLIIIIVFFSR